MLVTPLVIRVDVDRLIFLIVVLYM